MTSNNETPIPAGYWQDANGVLTPESRVAEIDKLRHDLVTELVTEARTRSGVLAEFKRRVMADMQAFVAVAAEKYGAKLGGKKGNVSLVSYDGKFKVQMSIQDTLHFGPELQAAKVLIDECILEWSQGVNDNIRALVMHAFQTDKEGKISTDRVLGLRRLAIHGDRWQNAMQAISDSVQVAHSKAYVRFYERDPATDVWRVISLDMANV